MWKGALVVILMGKKENLKSRFVGRYASKCGTQTDGK
jgi:hypothetical protein